MSDEEDHLASDRRPRPTRPVHRIGVVAAVFAATLAVAALPWFAQLTGGAAGAQASGDPSATLSPEPSVRSSADASPSAGASRLFDPARDLTELTRRLRDAARRIVPESTFAPVPVSFPEGGRTLSPFQVIDNGHGYYVAFAEVRDTAGAGTVTFALWPSAESWKAPALGCDAAYSPRLGCETRIGPGAERITIDSGVWRGTETVEYEVTMHRVDGTILVARASTAVYGGSQTVTPPLQPRSAPPMTTDQLVALLLTPGLALAH